MGNRRFKVREVGRAEPPAQTRITADITGGRFDPPSRDLVFDSVKVGDVDFSGIRCWRLTATRSRFERCKFDEMEVEHGPLGAAPGSVFVDCSFKSTDLRTVDPGHARFERCSFDRALIEEWFAFCAEFVDCTFSHAKIVGSKFSAKPIECGFGRLRGRRQNEFRGNDFREADLIDTWFVNGVDLDAQRLPDNEDYLRFEEPRAVIARVREQVLAWPDAKEQGSAIGVLDALEFLAEGQRELLVRRATFDLPPGVEDRFWRLLGAGRPRSS